MTLSDQEVLDIVNGLLDHEGVPRGDRIQHVRARHGVVALHALETIITRYLAIVDPPRTCQVEHDHWEGRMVCGRELPCPRHGGNP